VNNAGRITTKMRPQDDVTMNIMNERRAEVDKNPTIECEDEQCNNTTGSRDAEGWLLHASPDVPVLCPSCRKETPQNRLTPTEAQRENNQQLTEYL